MQSCKRRNFTTSTCDSISGNLAKVYEIQWKIVILIWEIVILWNFWFYNKESLLRNKSLGQYSDSSNDSFFKKVTSDKSKSFSSDIGDFYASLLLWMSSCSESAPIQKLSQVAQSAADMQDCSQRRRCSALQSRKQTVRTRSGCRLIPGGM